MFVGDNVKNCINGLSHLLHLYPCSLAKSLNMATVRQSNRRVMRHDQWRRRETAHQIANVDVELCAMFDGNGIEHSIDAPTKLSHYTSWQLKEMLIIASIGQQTCWIPIHGVGVDVTHLITHLISAPTACCFTRHFVRDDV